MANCHEFVDSSACQVLALEADVLEFERALSAIFTRSRPIVLHGSTADTKLLRMQRI